MAKGTVNPANVDAEARGERKRIPMSLPRQKLSVPEIPGYHLHWMLGTPERIAQALEAWYEFVDENEATMENVDIGGDTLKSGNTDLGSRVSRGAGSDIGTDGQPVRLYLMKIKQEYWEEDQKILGESNARVADTLMANFRSGTMVGPDGVTQPANMDTSHRYVDIARTKEPDFFKPKVRRVP